MKNLYSHIKNLYWITDYIKITLTDLPRNWYNNSLKYIEYTLHIHNINHRLKEILSHAETDLK